MAVQAQYPSNVLLLNRNVAAEGKINHQLGNDYNSLNQQSGGGAATSSRFFDQSHFLLNNIGVGNSGNPRKRGREVNNNQFMSSSMQQQQSQLIDLTQLHSHPQPPPPNVVSTGLRLAFNDQQLQHHHQQQQQHQQNRHHHQQQQQQQRQQSHQHSVSPQSSVVLSLLSDDLSSQINHQRDEIEQFIQSQAEELRRTLTEKRQRHYRALLGAAEESVARRLREKEAEFEKAARRNAELEARAAQLTAEAQVWQARARTQEATAATLQAQLQQAIMSGVGGGAQNNNIDRGEDGSSAVGDAEDAESAYIDPDRVVVASSTRTSGPGNCKACGKLVASVVLLPCRHLCICTECQIPVRECPVCLSFTNSSIPVFLS